MDATTDITAETLDTMLRRIRGLLDKAEATDVEAEQEVFFAKASDLMARYRIDNAMVEASRPKADRGEVIARDVNLGSGPYVMARLDLIGAVARSFGCRTLTRTGWNGRVAIIHGFESDVATVEVLYTSLLVQATRAMKATPVPTGDHGTPFRRTFISAFAGRVEERLAERNAEATAEAQAKVDATEVEPDPVEAAVEASPAAATDSVAMVLADRKAEVDDYISKRYGRLGSAPSRGGRHSYGGSKAGRAAGSRADITTGGRVSSGARGLNA